MNTKLLVPELPSFWLTPASATVALSSLSIVPVPLAVPRLTPGLLGVPRFTAKVSFASTTLSPVTDTVKLTTSPAVPAKVSCMPPGSAVKSLPAVAVPFAVLTGTVSPPCTAALKVAVNPASVLPALPSVTLVLLIDTVALSSLVIVPVAVPVPTVTAGLLGVPRLTVKVSFASTLASPFTSTVTSRVSPAVPVKFSTLPPGMAT